MARSPSTVTLHDHNDDDDETQAMGSNDQFVAELSGRLSKALILKNKAQQELSEYKTEVRLFLIPVCLNYKLTHQCFFFFLLCH